MITTNIFRMVLKKSVLVVISLVLVIVSNAQVGKGLQPGQPASPIPGKRIALVIGNSMYAHGARLKNPMNDAVLMEQTLCQLNFDVILVIDASLQVMEQSLTKFTEQIESGGYELALCYYSGHGLEVNGSNYLLPVDGKPNSQSDIKYCSLDAARILDGMDAAGAVTKLLVLDACRDNPLPKGWSKSMGAGLAALTAPKGSLVAYATAPGKKAWDGDGPNSPYTTALARFLKEPGLDIFQVFTKTAAATQDAVQVYGVEQVPYLSSSLRGQLILTPGQSGMEVSQTPSTLQNQITSYSDTLAGRMILVEGGIFQMGCSKKQRECARDERPSHQVSLEDYFLGETEVTVGQFKRFVDETGYRTDAEKRRSRANWRSNSAINESVEGKYEEHPVYYVSWDDAVAYTNWLSNRTGVQYRLPTEAEWEFAALGGRQSHRFRYAGGNLLEEIGWYKENSGGGTKPVRRKKPNELGLYDLTGNVGEWCSDWYGDYKVEEQSQPVGPTSGFYRVFRGGSWGDNASRCRTTNRRRFASSLSAGYLGFRLARSY